MKLSQGTGESINLGASLENQILDCEDQQKLIDLLDTQAFAVAPSPRLDLHLRTFISNPVPFLTAKVLRVYRLTGCMDEAIHSAAAVYLNPRAYDGEWYDETINSIGWANELLADGLRTPLTAAYAAFLAEIEREGHQELLDFCARYRR